MLGSGYMISFSQPNKKRKAKVAGHIIEPQRSMFSK